MRVHVTFYGGLKQDVGTRQQAVELPGDAPTVGALVETLAMRYPALAERLATVACAVGDTLVGPDHPLRDGDEAALLPPVSGG
ncbi:MAG: MoaD/ThiS family protein [Anaerolineae bacterium]|nr:MoaD/ThiS family protein [Anaerolineae bacterium]